MIPQSTATAESIWPTVNTRSFIALGGIWDDMPAPTETISSTPRPESDRQGPPPSLSAVREAARIAPGEVVVIDTEAYLPAADRVTIRGHDEPGAWRVGMIGVATTDAGGRIRDIDIYDASGGARVMFRAAAEKISREEKPILSWNGRTFDLAVIRRDPTARELVEELTGRTHIDIARWAEASKGTQRVTLTDGGGGVESAAAVAQSIREPDTQPDAEGREQLQRYLETDLGATAARYREYRALARRSAASD